MAKETFIQKMEVLNETIGYQKQQQVDELAAKFQEAKTIVTFDYPGLTVAQFTKLRHELRKKDAKLLLLKQHLTSCF